MNAVEVFTSEGSLQVTGEGYAPDALVKGRGVEKAAQAALAARTASQGRAELHDGQWRAQGDPMEAALDVLARRLTGTGAGPARPDGCLRSGAAQGVRYCGVPPVLQGCP
jgi:hypothetical protein